MTRNGNTVTQTDESYVYNRSLADYNALGITLTATKKGLLTIINAKVRYSFFNSIRRATTLTVMLNNGDEINLPLKLTRAAKTDNKTIFTNSYETSIQADLVQKLITIPAATVEISSATNYKFCETFTVDEALFKQKLQCLKESQ